MAKKRSAAVPLASPRRAEVVSRLKSARGHLDGILGMIDDDAYCIDLLMQLSAVRAALNGVSHLIVQHHLDHCFMKLVRSGDEKGAVAELLSTLAFDPHSA
jgi:CsoR family transcriptional regulator, copper-sensing transcriptional repressor